MLTTVLRDQQTSAADEADSVVQVQLLEYVQQESMVSRVLSQSVNNSAITTN